MIPTLVAKARSRVRIAKKAAESLKSAQDHTEFSDTWYVFLVAAKNVYTALEQGAKYSAACRQWFGGKKSERRTDPLLQYLFQARDDEEHGIEYGTEERPGGLGIGICRPGYSGSMHIRSLEVDAVGNIALDATSLDGKPILLEIQPARSVLKAVTGRGNITYSPPTSHLGDPISENSPIMVADLALTYLTRLVDEAERRADANG